MICPRCKCVFCQDDADECGPRKYCSKICQRKSAPGFREQKLRWQRNAKSRRKQEKLARRREEQLAICAEKPKKGQYVNRRVAEAAAQAIMRSGGAIMHPYECACGQWHLTRRLQGW